MPKVSIKNHDDGLGLSISRSGITNIFELSIELELLGYPYVKTLRSKLRRDNSTSTDTSNKKQLPQTKNQKTLNAFAGTSGYMLTPKGNEYKGADVLLTDSIYGKKVPDNAKGKSFLYQPPRML